MLAARIGRGLVKAYGNMRNGKAIEIFRNLPGYSQSHSTFKNEMSLPHLPIPPLQQTMEKYLLSMKPLLTQNEFECTKSSVKDFSKAGGVGEQLQEKLVSRSYKTENWLAQWWDDVAYFECESPVVINSSPGIAFPKQRFSKESDQLSYSAKMIRAVLGFKSLIDSESLPPDMQGNDPLTMAQYSRLLSSCRIPHRTKDYAVTTPVCQSRHIIVMCNDQAFEMDVYRGTVPLDEAELELSLKKIVDMAQNRKENHAIGALTSTDRRIWGRTYKELRKDAVNRKSLDRIIESVFVLCLDKRVDNASNDAAICEDPFMSVTVNQVLHGGGSNLNSCNRWFDKIFQVIVSEDGHVGCCYEHSSAEGPPVQLLCNHIISRCAVESSCSFDNPMVMKDPLRLEWRISDDIKEKVIEAKQFIDQLVGDLDMKMIRYTAYGKNVPKANRISPDAYIQIALQLAYFRLHGHMAPTYESASTRRFRLGRTDTIRSASIAAKAFCESMLSSDAKKDGKYSLLMKAISDHTKYTKEATYGQAIDRHLLGLKLICLETNTKLPEIFRDKGYNYGLHFKLSTSQVPSPHDTVLCFGPVVPDGYGICYNPLEESLNFSVSSFNSNPQTNSSEFAKSLKLSLDDIQMLLLKGKL